MDRLMHGTRGPGPPYLAHEQIIAFLKHPFPSHQRYELFVQTISRSERNTKAQSVLESGWGPPNLRLYSSGRRGRGARNQEPNMTRDQMKPQHSTLPSISSSQTPIRMELDGSDFGSKRCCLGIFHCCSLRRWPVSLYHRQAEFFRGFEGWNCVNRFFSILLLEARCTKFCRGG